MYQVELKEYVKLKDCIYEVDIKAENNLTLSRPLNYKVKYKGKLKLVGLVPVTAQNLHSTEHKGHSRQIKVQSMHSTNTA